MAVTKKRPTKSKLGPKALKWVHKTIKSRLPKTITFIIDGSPKDSLLSEPIIGVAPRGPGGYAVQCKVVMSKIRMPASHYVLDDYTSRNQK